MAKGKNQGKDEQAVQTEQAAQDSWDQQPGHQSLDQGDEDNPHEQHVQSLVDEHRLAVGSESWDHVLETEGAIRALGEHEIVNQLISERPALATFREDHQHEIEADVPVGGSAFAEACKRASPRELIDALINRIGRVEAVRGVKWPPLRVMAQELRDAKQSMEGHPALDEKRP